MAHLDVFSGSAFSSMELSAAIQKVPYVPQTLGAMGIFTPKGVRTTQISVEERSGTLALILTSPRGSPLGIKPNEKRNLRNFSTVRIAKQHPFYAEEIQNIRGFGSESELQQVQAEVASRMSDLRRDVELTHENMRLGALHGSVKDADGSEIINWFTAFGIAEPTEVDYDLDAASPASGIIRKRCTATVRAVQKAALGAWLPGTRVVGLCGDAFWDDLIAHPEVRATYLNQAAAAELRGVAAWQQLDYGGITFINYRGTNDGTTVAVGTDKCRFFPVGASPDLFVCAYSPMETFDFVNTVGQDVYALTVPDRDRNAFVLLEVYSYPLHMCTRPGVLQSARRT